ncbi:hypothetical protein ScPMuIL_013152 [Solemya velum]
MEELVQLIEHEIPDGRQHLQESHSNLERVAQYCQTNYLQLILSSLGRGKRQENGLGGDKNYTTHSLASVAYQINSLATNFLKLLDLQNNQLAEMESDVNYLAQTVNIHKEKVARREIGVLTTNRIATRPLGVKNGIIFPEQAERPVKYQRKGIDYGLLDDVGHGVRGSISGSISGGQTQRPSRSSSMSSSSSQAPTTRPPTPPLSKTLGRNAGMGGHYRTPAPPVAPPSVPHTNYAMSQVATQRSSGYSPYGANAPVIGISRPISQSTGPPPSPIIREGSMIHQGSIVSPPLPPPPSATTGGHRYDFQMSNSAPPPPQFKDHLDDSMDQPIIPVDEDPYAATGPDLTEPSWIPSSYIEKVVAIYDYNADKPDELSFSENSVIYVVKKNDDDWWEGVLDGTTGLFPGNYVEPCMSRP